MARWRFWKRKPRAPRMTPEVREIHNHARKHYNAKEYSKAEPYLRELLKFNPADEWALDVLSRLLMNTNRQGEAIHFLEKLNVPGPDQSTFQTRLARCHFNASDYSETINILQSKIYENTIDDDDWDLLRRSLPRDLNQQEIDNFWVNLAEANLKFPQIDIEMIRIDLQESQLSEAAQRIQRVTMDTGDIQLSDKWKLELVKVLLEQGTPNIAEQIIRDIPENTPEYTKILIKIKRDLGDNESALQTAQSALEKKSDHGVMFAAMRLAWDLGSMEEVVSFAERIIVDKPTQRVAHRFRLRALVKIGDVSRIESAVEDSLNQLPDFIEAHRVMIDIYFHEYEDWKRVNHHCEAILKVDPKDRRALCHLIHSLLRMEEYREVEKLIEKSTKLHPDNDEIDLTSAHAHWKMEDKTKHIERINRMLTRHNLEPIYSIAENQSISVENLRCDAPSTSMENIPLVSIIMTVYGRDEFLDVAIDSILNQSHQNIELIVVDDCSPDDAFEYLQKRASKEPKMRVLQVEQNGGTYCAKNSAISIANGDYVGFMDSDDWTHPQRIQRQVQAIHNTDHKAVCHSYFRINEFGDIFYKGVGAIRLACISLLAKRSVFEKIGHFDSMRVGADTEYIERIKAAYGDEAVLHEPIPSMFMLNHSTSLTGGGRFHISWRSITGPRLEHHSSFRSWHKKIRFADQTPYVEFPLRVRPYTIPEEMIAGDLHWKEGVPLFSERIKSRNERWWMGAESAPWQGQISEKSAGLLYAKQQGIQTPKLLWSGENLEDLPKLADLPKRIVIKPSKGYSAHNVLCLVNGKNVLDESFWDDEKIQTQFGTDQFLQRVKPKWMVEEFLKPESLSEDEKIPRDWKFYCFGEEIALIHVVLRNSTVDKSANIHHYFTSDLRQLQRRVCTSRPVPADPLFFPDCWDEMVTQVKKLGKKLGCFMRIDMYATETGPVFGEFTPTPEGGEGFTEWADRYLATFWKGVEGVEN